LQLKEQLNLFDRPSPDPNSPLLKTIGCSEDRLISLNITRESITLLENPNQVLPLKAENLKQFLVVGPTSNSLRHLCGGLLVTVKWLGAPDDSYFKFGSTVFDGIQKIAGQKNRNAKVIHREGCNLNGENNQSCPR